MPSTEHNPLKPAILNILRQSSQKLAIHELLTELKSTTRIPHLHDNEQLALFRLNWMMMNALYQLQSDFAEDNLLLVISTLDIHLESLSGNHSAGQLKALKTDNLRNYYLDWRNFSETTIDEVKALLDGVWQDYISTDEQSTAYQTLGLEATADKRTIRTTYRKLAHQHHPDRGGDADIFMSIRHAYEVLKRAKNF